MVRQRLQIIVTLLTLGLAGEVYVSGDDGIDEIWIQFPDQLIRTVLSCRVQYETFRFCLVKSLGEPTDNAQLTNKFSTSVTRDKASSLQPLLSIPPQLYTRPHFPEFLIPDNMVLNGLDPSHLDRSVDPKHDFYRFANGGWLDNNPIPPSYSRWGSFEELSEKSYAQLRAILEECVDNHQDDPNKKACALLYATGMNEEACAKAALSPLDDVFAAVDDLKHPHEVLPLRAKLSSQYGVGGGLFVVYSLPDAKNSSWEVVMLSQRGSLGIGDRDFYFREDKKEIREKYVVHIANVLELGGWCQGEEAKKVADDIMDLETKIAESCMTKTELRDPLKTYNKCNGVAELTEKTHADDNMNWKSYFNALGLPEEARKTIIVDNPTFFSNLNSLLQETNIYVWKMYLRFHILKSMANYLSPNAVEQHFAFFGKVMTGQQEMKPRWKRVLNEAVVSKIEDCIGILYTDRHFNSAAKKACLDMVNICTDVLRSRIDELDWMQDVTKEKAREKLDKFRPMIGYPDRWDVDDIPDLLKVISTDKTYCENMRACNVRDFRKLIERIDKPVDPYKWEMPCTLVNAYFHPLKNVIVFPAAILQPPFFYHPDENSPHGDVAINFAAIGAVICHEIS